MAANQTEYSRHEDLRSANLVKFTEVCMMCIKKHVLVKIKCLQIA